MTEPRELLQTLVSAYQADFGPDYQAESFLDWVAISIGLADSGSMNRGMVEMYAAQARRRAALFPEVERFRFALDGRLLGRDEHAGWCSHDTRRGCNCGLEGTLSP